MSKKKKLFVTTDIHGHYTILKEALESAGFDPADDDHLLVCCGDYFDRGDENDLVMQYLERIENKVLILGNHEDLLLDLLYSGKVMRHHHINGTMKTIENIFGSRVFNLDDGNLDFSGKTRDVDRVCDFIADMVNYFETKNYVFVHGWVTKNGQTFEGRLEASSEEWKKARWEGWTSRYNNERPLLDKTLVCGHVATFYAAYREMNRVPTDSSIYEKDGFLALDACTIQSGKINVFVAEDELL